LPANHQDEHEQRLALFIDFENIAIGVRDAHYRKFDVNLVLERLLDKGKLLVKKAYADWSRYADYKRSFHEAAIELIEVPQKSVGGKNSADIRLVVDAMDMSFQKEHINCFVVASGDSDFSPLVSKLKENNKYVIGLGVKNSTSDLLIENCDEFIFYEDLVRGQQRPVPVIANANEKQQEVFALLVDSILALQRENKEVLWGSMVKETMKRKKPSFNETYYGFRTFSHLLEDAQRRGIVVLRRDQKSGSYVVEDLGPGSVATSSRPEAVTASAPPPPPTPRLVETAPAPSAAPPETAEAAGAPRPPRRRRSRGRKPRGASVLAAGAYIDPASASAHPADEGGDLGYDQDEGGDDEHHEDAGADMAEDAGGADEHSTDGVRPGSADRDEREQGQERERPLPPASDPAQPERPAFSLFSWMKRDPVPRPSPAAGESERPPGTKPDPLE
jgi:uncharacterized LabA/DUF88 family protein